uniref:Uncharacterized protein n=1 Tax=Enterobius vermicularis TaxID=51028 RepID=A0A0N4VQS0_ENTVE
MRRADIEVPNHAVAMSARARSACYPRGTFYPLSDGASTSHRQITSPDFRPCSTCQSHSQAPLCTYTHHLITNQAEGTFGRLRYPLGGDRPSQTTHQALSLNRITVHNNQNNQSGISPTTPPPLAWPHQRLPPILHKPSQSPIPNYSKGPGVFPSCCA